MYIPVKHRKTSARSDFLGKHPKNTTTTVFSEASTPLPRCFMTCPHLTKHLIMVYLTFWLKAHTFTLGKPDPSTPKVWRSTPCVVWVLTSGRLDAFPAGLSRQVGPHTAHHAYNPTITVL